MVQFVKGRSDTGEEAFFRQQTGVTWHTGGEGFTWETQDKARDAAAAQAAWAVACQHLADPAINLVILDEFTYAFKYQWLDLDAVCAVLRAACVFPTLTGSTTAPFAALSGWWTS